MNSSGGEGTPRDSVEGNSNDSNNNNNSNSGVKATVGRWPADAAAPSNQSIWSGRPSTISSYQSSVFSRNAHTVNTMSSVGSSRNPYGLAPVPDESGSTSSSTADHGRLKVRDLEEMSSLENVAPTRIRQPAAVQQRSFQAPAIIPGDSLSLPDVQLQNVSSHLAAEFGAGSSPARSFAPSSSPLFQRYGASPSSNSASASSVNVGTNQHTTPQNELRKLADELRIVLDQCNFKVMDLGRAANAVNQLLRAAASSPALESLEQDAISVQSEPSITQILKVTLHFLDTLLRSLQFQRLKMYILRSLYQLGVKLKLVPQTLGTVPYPRNFAVGSVKELPAQSTLNRLMECVITSSDSSSIAEQEGAFIAPVLRGLAPGFALLTLSFGFPRPDAEHYDMIASMYDITRDIHIYCQKNYIRTCHGGFKAPYRILTDSTSPPISISLATIGAVTISGTLGGYLYPKIDTSDPSLAEYARSTFAITCAHVCLSENSGNSYPHVSVPSPVLINCYRKALETEKAKFPVNSLEREEFQKAIQSVEKSYKDAQSNEPFGRVVWGERTIVDGSISDLAIVKCSKNLQCRNYLGDDISFSEYDPALMFGNLYVKKVVRKLVPGMNVFKYGSTSKYTSGKINGPRLVYWADGKIQSSEFVVASESPLFASGGDSGAWILQKSEDQILYEDESSNSNTIENVSEHGSSITNSVGGLGVVGMVHSYDGERKELGLFTPITTILERLEAVTHIKWGVVGVPDDNKDLSPAGGSDSSGEENDDGASSDGN